MPFANQTGGTPRHAGEDATLDVQKISEEWVPFTVSGASTTAVKTGAGVLGPFQVEVIGTSIQFFDSTDGSGTAITPLISTAGPKDFKGLTFSNGLSYTSVGATHASGGGYK